jgi:hypothetical protein
MFVNRGLFAVKYSGHKWGYKIKIRCIGSTQTI